MTMTMPLPPGVEIAEPADVERAEERALTHLGMTYGELRDEARNDDFRSERARTAWLMLRDPRERL